MKNRPDSFTLPVVILAWFVHILLLWSYRFVPSVDYPDWLLQSAIVAHYNDPAYGFSTWYEIVKAAIPNGGFVLPAAALARILPVEVAGKIVLTLYLVWFPLSVRSFMRSTGNDSPLWTVGILMLFNVSFVYGNLAFLIGTCLLFTALGFAERTKDHRTVSAGLGYILLTFFLFSAHAVCAFAFFLFTLDKLVRRSTAPGARRNLLKEKGAYLASAALFIFLAFTYYFTRPGGRMIGELSWGLEFPYRFSLIMKSFIAGWAFPPYEFSPIRTTANAAFLIFVLSTGFLSLRRIVLRPFASPIGAFAIVLAAATVLAPKTAFGNSELSQRLAILTFIVLCGLLQVPARSRTVVSLCVTALIFLATLNRWYDYSKSSLLIKARYEFLGSVLPPGPELLTFDDDLHANATPFLHLVPKGMHFIYQTDYHILKGGYSPLVFRSGFVFPRDDFFLTLDRLAGRRTPEGLLSLRGSDIPPGVGFVILDWSSEWGEKMTRAMEPQFSPAAETEIAPGVHTTVLQRNR